MDHTWTSAIILSAIPARMQVVFQAKIIAIRQGRRRRDIIGTAITTPNRLKTIGEIAIWKGWNVTRKLSGIGAIVVFSVLSGLLLCGCGPSIQAPAAGSGQAELDLSCLLVWETQDTKVVVHRRLNRGGYKRVQAFYDRTGRRIEGLKLGYMLGGVWWQGQAIFSDGLASASLDDENDLIGFVDRAGRVVIPFQYYYTFPFSDGRAVAAVNDSNDYKKRRVGLIDRQGRWIVPAGKYKKVRSCNEGRCAFQMPIRAARWDPWGFLDANGSVVVQPRFRNVEDYSEGLSLVDDGNSMSFIDRQGRTAFRLPDNVQNADSFSCGRAMVVVGTRRPKPAEDDVSEMGMPEWSNLRTGFISPEGSMVIKPVYTAAGSFTEGLAPVSMTKDARFTSCEDEIDGLPAFSAGGKSQKWGFIDTTGKLVIPMKFTWVSQFSDGLARVYDKGKWGFIDKTGAFVIPPRYEWVKSFKNGIAFAVLDGMIILIDRQGKTIVNTGSGYAVF